MLLLYVGYHLILSSLGIPLLGKGPSLNIASLGIFFGIYEIFDGVHYHFYILRRNHVFSRHIFFQTIISVPFIQQRSLFDAWNKDLSSLSFTVLISVGSKNSYSKLFNKSELQPHSSQLQNGVTPRPICRKQQ